MFVTCIIKLTYYHHRRRYDLWHRQLQDTGARDLLEFQQYFCQFTSHPRKVYNSQLYLDPYFLSL